MASGQILRPKGEEGRIRVKNGFSAFYDLKSRILRDTGIAEVDRLFTNIEKTTRKGGLLKRVSSLSALGVALVLLILVLLALAVLTVLAILAVALIHIVHEITSNPVDKDSVP